MQNSLGNYGAQHWKISGPQGYDMHGGSLRYFQNRHSKMCISGTDYHPNIPDAYPGLPFIQRWCTFGNAPTVEETQSQRFWVSNTADMWAERAFTLRNEKSGLCVDVQGASNAEDAPAVQYGCHGRSNQRFRLMYAGS